MRGSVYGLRALRRAMARGSERRDPDEACGSQSRRRAEGRGAFARRGPHLRGCVVTRSSRTFPRCDSFELMGRETWTLRTRSPAKSLIRGEVRRLRDGIVRRIEVDGVAGLGLVDRVSEVADSQANPGERGRRRAEVALDANFYTYDFPAYFCSQYADVFVALLDCTFAGSPANPADKNLASYRPSSADYPISVDLISGGFFAQCINGTAGCAGITSGVVTSCIGDSELQGTGFGQAAANNCDANTLAGGATGWLSISGNVVGGEIIRLRIAIWDTLDESSDSLIALDHFRWSTSTITPGIVPGTP